MGTNHGDHRDQDRSGQGQIPPMMLLLQQLLGLPQDQQPSGSGSTQETPSAPPTSDPQDPPPPPSHQQQTPPQSTPGHQQTSPPPPPFGPGHQQHQAPPQQSQFCSNCSGSRRPRQDECRQYIEKMIPVIINKCRHFSAVFTRSMFSVVSVIMMICLINAIPNTIISNILFMMICTGFGLHLPTILAANVLHCFLINMNPFFLTIFSIWAFHKTVIQKRPLFNINYWRRNFSNHCHHH